MMIDSHCHVLPSIDDGAKDAETSVKMLQKMHEQNIDLVIFTPHYYRRKMSVETFIKIRNHSVELLKEKLESGNYTIPNYILGSEVAYFEGISTVKEIKKLCIEGTDLMLLELPFTTWDSNLIHELRSLEEQRGVKLILAHIERYFSFKENRKLLNELIDSRFLIQLNAECFSSYFKRIRLLRMIRLGQVDFLGSDSHNLDTRCPNLDIARKVISRKLGQDTLLSLDHRSKSILDKYTKKIGRSINGTK